MAKFYSSILDLGNLGHRKVAVCNVNPEDLQQSNNVSVDKMHHIQVLDRSGSMYRDIDDLIENVKDTIRFIPDGDYVSIIWFSLASGSLDLRSIRRAIICTLMVRILWLSKLIVL